jgi:hypothetical protein
MASIRRNNPEQQICQAFIRRLRQYHPDISAIIYHIKNESKTAHHADDGINPGIPDYCLPIPKNGYGALYLEFKTKTGTLSDVQKSRVSLLELYGNKCVVCRNWEDGVNAIDEYLRSS